MGHPVLIDLEHLGRPRSLAVYLVPGPEPTLIDCGPSSCLDVLERTLAGHGLRFGDLRHLLLTHIHLDHAGAAGSLVATNPDLLVHVSGAGADHLADPSRLERSARRLFGAEFDRLWGPLAPIPAANLRVLGEHAAGLECFATPGHAIHHTSFLDEDGNCYSGDVTGVRIPPSTYVAPGTPPPDIDLDAYRRSLDDILSRRPERLCLSHFGIAEDVPGHIARMREGLALWSGWVRDGATEDEFIEAARAQLADRPEVLEAIETAAPFPPSYAGLKRYWETRRRPARAVAATR
ncbi:MAG TPA: MBL fold metallo-hydrolase [Solirubrobacteraceae bacterium]